MGDLDILDKIMVALIGVAAVQIVVSGQILSTFLNTEPVGFVDLLRLNVREEETKRHFTRHFGEQVSTAFKSCYGWEMLARSCMSPPSVMVLPSIFLAPLYPGPSRLPVSKTLVSDFIPSPCQCPHLNPIISLLSCCYHILSNY